MTVGHVELGHAAKRIGERLAVGFVIYHPENMANAVRSREVVHRLALGQASHEGIDLGTRTVGQKDRSGVGVKRIDVTRAIVLLHPPGVLVLLDQVCLVFVDAGPRDNAGLDMVAHDLSVEIVGRSILAQEHAPVDKALQIVSPPGVDLRRIEVDSRLEVDLGLDNVQERQGIVTRESSRLLARHDVVRRARHPGAQIWARAPCSEGFDSGHRLLLVGLRDGK